MCVCLLSCVLTGLATNTMLVCSGLLNSGLTYSSFVDVELDVNPVQMVEFVWHKNIFSILHPKLGASAVTLQYGPSGEMYV